MDERMQLPVMRVGIFLAIVELTFQQVPLYSITFFIKKKDIKRRAKATSRNKNFRVNVAILLLINH